MGVLLTVGAMPAWATQFVGAERALRHTERIAATVAVSPMIAVGHLVSMYDSTVAVAPGSWRVTFSIAIFEPMRVLRGRAPGKRFRFVESHAPDAESHLPLNHATRVRDLRARAPVLICFDDLGPLNPQYRLNTRAAMQSVSRWTASRWGDPNRMPQISDWSLDLEREVREEIARETPEVLTQGAERIVLASSSIRGEHAVWRIERVLKGGRAESLRLRPVLVSERDGASRALLFVRRVGDLYEPVPLVAGIVPVEGNRVAVWSCSLNEAIARITRSLR